ncbi:MAG: hypothetical protein JWN04_1595 [Myxococcaceae bacterium]|nr:hypothetical protein [Myxococcaceae bacterium]
MSGATQLAQRSGWWTEIASGNPSRQAFHLLHWGFTAAPLIAGGDKFVGLLAHWEQYLSPAVASLSPLSPHGTMLAVGGIELFAAALVAFRPRLGAYVVAAWLLGIIANLLLLGAYFDVALRDFGLLLAALALGRLSMLHAADADLRQRPR